MSTLIPIISPKNLIQAFNDNPIVIHRIYLKLTKDYATAAALAQVMYWHKKMGKRFYKTDTDFMDELCLTTEQFKRVKSNLKKISFLTIEVKGIPAKTFYDVNYEAFALEIEKIDLQATNNNRLGENPQTGSGENPQTNTENTQRIHRDNNNTVDVDLSIFTKKTEQAAAKKLLSPLDAEIQREVLAVLVVMIKTANITNKVGYLRAIVESVKNGTFTPLPDTIKPLTAQERIDKENAAKKAAEERTKVDNNVYFAELEKKYGIKANKQPQNEQIKTLKETLNQTNS